MADEAKLRIVNGILGTLGKTVTASLASLHPDVLQAVALMTQQDFDFQGIGWTFNTDTDVMLLPAIDGTVAVPDNALTFSITNCLLKCMTAREKSRYTRRGNLVYDTILHTTNINVAIRADYASQLDIEDLPAVAQTYLGTVCNEAANLSDDGDNTKQQRLIDKRTEAWGRLHAAELKAMAVNALQTPQAQQLSYPRIGTGTGRNPLYLGG